MDTMITPQKKVQAIVAAILGILQVLSLFGVAVGGYMDFITGNEVMVMAIGSALMGMVQTWLTSAKNVTKTVDPNLVKMIVLFAVMGFLGAGMQGCARTNLPSYYPGQNYGPDGRPCLNQDGTPNRQTADGYVPWCQAPWDGDEWDPRAVSAKQMYSLQRAVALPVAKPVKRKVASKPANVVCKDGVCIVK